MFNNYGEDDFLDVGYKPSAGGRPTSVRAKTK
jgi:hypothetical protein